MASVQGTSSPLRLFVDKERYKVVVGEASGDFVDALLSFLTLPLGTIIRLVSNKQTHPPAELGCFNNLYQSVKNFNTEVLWNGICKKMLLCPRNPCEKFCQKLKFNVDDTEPTKHFMCASRSVSCSWNREKWVSIFAGTSCSCGALLDQEVNVKGERDINNPKEDGAFVRGKSMYLIFDDLTVVQNSARNTTHRLVELGYTDFTKLTEMSPKVGLNQIMDLLKSALISTSPLTDVFLAREAGGSKPVSSFTPRLASQNVQGSDSCYNLQIIVNKSKNKILYAEAEEDFADFLFSFLTLPIGSTLKLLNAYNLNLGSMHNLYKSVNGLNPSWFKLYPSPLLDLNVAFQHGCIKQRLLDVREEKSSFDRHESGWKIFEPRCADGRTEAVGYVRRPTILAITDDLQVTPLTSTSSISFLQKLKVPLNDLEEHKVTIHKNEALNLLGASLTSKAALTNGLFYLVKKQKEKMSGT